PVHDGHELEGLAVSHFEEHLRELVPAPAQRPDGGRARHGGRGDGSAGALRLAPRRRRARFFFQAEDGIRGLTVTGVQTCALPISFSDSSFTVSQRRRWPI